VFSTAGGTCGEALILTHVIVCVSMWSRGLIILIFFKHVGRMERRARSSPKLAETAATVRPDPATVPERSRDAIGGAAAEQDFLQQIVRSLVQSDRDEKSLRLRICEVGAVPDAVQTLVRAGVSEQYIWDALWEIEGCDLTRLRRILAVAPKSGKARFNWTLPDGMTLKTLRALPGRIAQLASEIERVNSEEWYKPGAFSELAFEKESGSPWSLRQRATRRLLDLPKTLRSYARHLRRRTKEVSSLRRGVVRGNFFDFELKKVVVRLATEVRDRTRKPYWSELSELVSAVLEETPAWAKDANSLRLFCKENRRLVPAPEPLRPSHSNSASAVIPATLSILAGGGSALASGRPAIPITPYPPGDGPRPASRREPCPKKS
jgi:hypothetical protein